MKLINKPPGHLHIVKTHLNSFKKQPRVIRGLYKKRAKSKAKHFKQFKPCLTFLIETMTPPVRNGAPKNLVKQFQSCAKTYNKSPPQPPAEQSMRCHQQKNLNFATRRRNKERRRKRLAHLLRIFTIVRRETRRKILHNHNPCVRRHKRVIRLMWRSKWRRPLIAVR